MDKDSLENHRDDKLGRDRDCEQCEQSQKRRKADRKGKKVCDGGIIRRDRNDGATTGETGESFHCILWRGKAFHPLELQRILKFRSVKHITF